jgi:ABC-2 type transport system ATP-binding protein
MIMDGEAQETEKGNVGPVVVIDGVTVDYGAVRALDAVNLVIGSGSTGLLGPNGSGKTTLLRVLLGLLIPKAGKARILGHDPGRRPERLAIRAKVGYLPEGDCLIPGMNAVELVASLARLTGLDAADAMTRAHEVLYYVGLDESRYRDATGYSTGAKQRLKLAQALVHDPSLLLLDEPTNGLDPKGRSQMLDLITDLSRTHGKNIILCSHLLPDVERVCGDVIVLHRGRMAGMGAIAGSAADERGLVKVSIGGPREAFSASLQRRGLSLEPSGNGDLRVRLPEGTRDVDEVFAAAAEAGVSIRSIETLRSSLEDVFMRSLRDSPGPGR